MEFENLTLEKVKYERWNSRWKRQLYVEYNVIISVLYMLWYHLFIWKQRFLIDIIKENN